MASPPLGDQLPESPGGDAAGVAAGHGDDRDRLVGAGPPGCRRAARRPGSGTVRRGVQPPGERHRGRGCRRAAWPAAPGRVAAPSRSRSSTAVSESNPSRLKESGVDRVEGERRPGRPSDGRGGVRSVPDRGRSVGSARRRRSGAAACHGRRRRTASRTPAERRTWAAGRGPRRQRRRPVDGDAAAVQLGQGGDEGRSASRTVRTQGRRRTHRPERSAAPIALSTPSGPISTNVVTPSPSRARGRRRTGPAPGRAAPSSPRPASRRSAAGHVGDDGNGRRRIGQRLRRPRRTPRSIGSISAEWNAWTDPQLRLPCSSNSAATAATASASPDEHHGPRGR